MNTPTRNLSRKQRADLLNLLRQAAKLRAQEWDMLAQAEEIMGHKTGLDELVDSFATDIATPASEESHLDKILGPRDLGGFLALQES